jgi:signal transduction histidine kinase
VQNIARNARDVLAHREDGLFTIDIALDGDELVLTFADNGTGVPLGFRHRMFDAFATQGKKDGTGLGLAMVKQFAQAHGGGVTYRDTAGGGATFEIRIARDPGISHFAAPVEQSA